MPHLVYTHVGIHAVHLLVVDAKRKVASHHIHCVKIITKLEGVPDYALETLS
jgi:hypothetical protein